MTLELRIVALGAGGDGIAETTEGPVYVPYTLPGERVRARPGPARGSGRAAEVTELLDAAPERVVPPCRHFGICGGCALQHFAAATYLEWKRGLVLTALARRGLTAIAVRPCVATPPGSRRRVRLRALVRGGGASLGLNRRRRHEIVPLSECPLLRPALTALLRPLAGLLPKIVRERRPVDVQLTATNGGVDLWIASDAARDLAADEALAAFAAAHDLARVCWGTEPETVLRRRPAALRFGPAQVEPPPSTFLQPSAEGEAAILRLAGEALDGAAPVADLFAGAGTLSLPLGAALAVDADAPALAALDVGARAVDRPLETLHRDLFRRPLLAVELADYAAVVLDPPRAGARAQAEALAASSVPTVVMVSCNPASFARDARILVDGGFRLDWIAPIDQFLWSPEVELVARFSR
jgi:23S rRNA (uracil1939-C5)-methyltransferase